MIATIETLACKWVKIGSLLPVAALWKVGHFIDDVTRGMIS